MQLRGDSRKSDLTVRQERCLRYIVQYTFEHLYQPSLREIAAYMSIGSTNGVDDHLRALQRKGYLTIRGRSARALVLNDSALLFVRCSEDLRARPIVVQHLRRTNEKILEGSDVG
jgi:SOS-response transcriptional repressor LexA